MAFRVRRPSPWRAIGVDRALADLDSIALKALASALRPRQECGGCPPIWMPGRKRWGALAPSEIADGQSSNALRARAGRALSTLGCAGV
jgi:hypothetical protein